MAVYSPVATQGTTEIGKRRRYPFLFFRGGPHFRLDGRRYKELKIQWGPGKTETFALVYLTEEGNPSYWKISFNDCIGSQLLKTTDTNREIKRKVLKAYRDYCRKKIELYDKNLKQMKGMRLNGEY